MCQDTWFCTPAHWQQRRVLEVQSDSRKCPFLSTYSILHHSVSTVFHTSTTLDLPPELGINAGQASSLSLAIIASLRTDMALQLILLMSSHPKLLGIPRTAVKHQDDYTRTDYCSNLLTFQAKSEVHTIPNVDTATTYQQSLRGQYQGESFRKDVMNENRHIH